MTYVAKLLCGTKEFDLNAGRYELAQDFRPLPINLAPRSGSDTRRLQLDSPERDNRRWSFGLNINGASDAEVHKALEAVQYFLNRALEDGDPVYLGYKANADISYEPKYGQQGALMRYEIVEGRIIPPSTYGVASLRKKRLINCRVELVVKPIAEGRRMRIAQGQGGLLIDNKFTADGRSRGTIVAGATTNIVSNPIFGHATWNTNWTAGANLLEAENNDPRYVLYGDTSAKLTARDTTDGGYIISVTCANTNTHSFSFYAKLPSEGDVSATHVIMSYAGSGLTESYESVGNGWHRITATAAGVASARSFTVRVQTGYTVYVDGVQIEESAYPTPLCHGDMMGVAWAGTAHASDSTRTAAALTLNYTDTHELSEGGIHMAVRMGMNSTALDADIVFWRDNVANKSLHYSNSNNNFEFSDGTTTIGTGTQTWSVGDVVHVTATWSPANGIALYSAGVLLDSDGSYDPLGYPSTLNIGSTVTPTLQLNSTVMGFTSFANELTAAEVLAFYNNAVQLTNDDNLVDQIPWIWTDDGDGVVESCIESGSTVVSVFGGIPGSARAKTRYMTEWTSGPVFQSVSPLIEYIDPEDILFHDLSGTSTSSNDCGGEVDRGDPGTSEGTEAGAGPTDKGLFDYLGGRDYYMLVRVSANGGSDNLILRQRFSWSGGVIDGDIRSVGSGAGLFLLPPLTFYRAKDAFVEPGFVEALSGTNFYIRAYYDGANTGDVDLDFFVIMPSPILTIQSDTGTNYTIQEGLNSKEASDNTYIAVRDDFETTGDVNGVDLYPEKYNVMLTVSSPTIANTLTFERTYVTPRYALT